MGEQSEKRLQGGGYKGTEANGEDRTGASVCGGAPARNPLGTLDQESLYHTGQVARKPRLSGHTISAVADWLGRLEIENGTGMETEV